MTEYIKKEIELRYHEIKQYNTNMKESFDSQFKILSLNQDRVQERLKELTPQVEENSRKINQAVHEIQRVQATTHEDSENIRGVIKRCYFLSNNLQAVCKQLGIEFNMDQPYFENENAKAERASNNNTNIKSPTHNFNNSNQLSVAEQVNLHERRVISLYFN